MIISRGTFSRLLYLKNKLKQFKIFITKNYFLESCNILIITQLVCLSCIHIQWKLKLKEKLLILTVINVARLL